MVASGHGGFPKVAKVDSRAESTLATAWLRKRLILSQNFYRCQLGGFQVDSPVKKPVARKLPRCAPPYTDRAREEPEEGGRRPWNRSTAVLKPPDVTPKEEER